MVERTIVKNMLKEAYESFGFMYTKGISGRIKYEITNTDDAIIYIECYMDGLLFDSS